MSSSTSLSVVVPALNEEKNLRQAVKGLTNVLGQDGIDWEVILINDGSTDHTEEIATELVRAEPRIKLINHQKPMGIGRSFWDGVEASSKQGITWFPGDGENDPEELIKFLPLLEHVDIVVPFVINKEARSWRRRFVSKFYLWMVNLLFGTMFNYTTGNVIYRKNVFDIVEPKANGFTYQTECLIRAVRSGFTFAEVPVHLGKRLHGRSKILTFKSVRKATWELIRLFVEIRILPKKKRRTYVKHN